MNLVACFKAQQRRHPNSGLSDSTSWCLLAATTPVLRLALVGTLAPASQWRGSDLKEMPLLPAICAGKGDWWFPETPFPCPPGFTFLRVLSHHL